MNYETEASPFGVKKLMQVTEEVQKPVHVPVVLGNECFIITQQDIRKIEDVRFISYHKLAPNGELIPVQAVIGQEIALRDAILSAARFQTQSQDEAASRQLLEMLGKCCGQPTPIPIPTSTTASIEQQIAWAKSCNTTSPAYPFTYSKATSTSDMPHRQTLQCCCNQPCCCNCPPRYVTHQGCNTMETDPSTDHIEGSLSARQMLKIRKMIEDTMGI